MFWGLTLEAGKHYSQSIEDSFHVSMAALELQYDYTDRSPRPPVQVMVQHHKKDFLLCSLIHGTLIQQPLDLDFTEGEQVTFYLEGSESSEDGMEVSDEEGDAKEDLDETIPSLQQLASGQDLESEDDESEEEWTPVQKAESTKKRKSTEKTPTSQKKKKSEAKVKEEEEEDQSSEDEEDGDEEDIVDEMADLIKDIEENGNGGKEETDESGKKSKKKLSNGVVIEDTVVGDGKLARPLKMVGVYYKGTLAGRKQEFDSCLSGKPFRFRLGTKEVISGWDSGLAGMRVGGKRRLTIPPSQGYGKTRAGSIPPNSTLVFDVELKEVRDSSVLSDGQGRILSSMSCRDVDVC
ncbi:putative 46 kDa FK506-binding nuclear protein [Apostichopus japonicus]|uniref:peptidylprolyl isomerase n=1 Tax=Stichopus japonicus TaxID=307972 RepID=A0A2G8L0A9_STIJA|nr:putative 46 kDa FK506-binding nuclear protein [Apostichopus japonicus]